MKKHLKNCMIINNQSDSNFKYPKDNKFSISSQKSFEKMYSVDKINSKLDNSSQEFIKNYEEILLKFEKKIEIFFEHQRNFHEEFKFLSKKI